MILPTENQGPPDPDPMDHKLDHYMMFAKLKSVMPGIGDILNKEQMLVVAIVLVEHPKAMWHITLTQYFKEEGIENPGRLSLAINSFLL